MKQVLRALGLLAGLGGISSLALAASSWADFDAAFPALPCPDGWAGCVVDGTVVTPGMVFDSARRPHPSDMRFGFFEFESLPTSSPFSELSEYGGEPSLADAGEDDEPEERRTPPAPVPERQARVEREDREERSAPPPPPVPVPSERREEREERSAPPPPPVPVPTASNDDYGTDREARTNPNAAPSTARVEAEEPAAPPPPPPPVAEPEPEPPAPPPPPPVPEPEPEPVAVVTPPPPPPPPPVAEPAGCDDLFALEAPAMMGQLTAGQRSCLDRRIASESQQTAKKKVSLVLIMDAEARGDKKAWETLMKRHLTSIDRSDPNMCFKYAIHLSRGGAGKANSVIRWADYALENKQSWTGAQYKKNVYGLYKLRAQAANKLWEGASAAYVKSNDDASKQKSEQYRGLAKDYSREWLDYARASQQSTQSPMALCVSAAGNKDFCEG